MHATQVVGNAAFRIVTIGALVVMLAACGRGSGDAQISPSPSDADLPPTTNAAVSSPAAMSASSTVVTPSPVATTVPADVPTTGPNITKAGEAPPVMPVIATQHSAAGGVAFAKFFIQTMDWGYATTSSAYMKHYYEATCVECSANASGMDDAAQKHDRYIGDRFQNIRAVAVPAGPVAVADLAIKTTSDVTGAEAIDKAGKAIDAEPPKRGEIEIVYLAWRSNTWSVVDMIEGS